MTWLHAVVLCRSDLSSTFSITLTKIVVRSNQEHLYARQHTSISGLGYPPFDAATGQLEAFAQELAPLFEPGTWGGWIAPSTYEGHPALDANCRYFTQVSDGCGREDIPFDKVMDPRGFLERSKGSNFIHTQNNVVEFYRYHPDDDRSRMHSHIRNGELIIYTVTTHLTLASYTTATL